MQQFLAIDTTEKNVKISLLTKNTGLIEKVKDLGMNQAALLVPLVDNFLTENEVNIANIDSIIVNLGPGSYTSLRIGIATAKGLALPHNTNIIGINSFEIIKHFHIQNKDLNSAILIFNTPKQAYVQINGKEEVIDITKINEFIPKGFKLYGNGTTAESYTPYLKEYNLISESSSITGKDLINYVIDSKTENSNLEPLYIKPLTYKKQVK